MKTFTSRITHLKRLNNSYYGNPRFVVTFENGMELISKSDYNYNYNLENLLRKNCDCIVEWYSNKSSDRIQSIREI